MTKRLELYLALVLIGTAWGLTMPLTKIAVSGSYRNFGLVFWQFFISAIVLGVILLIRRRPLPLGRPQLRVYLIIALIGTILPNSASYEAARYLPAGIMSLIISTVPMFAFPIAIFLGMERVAFKRFFGLLFGLCGIALISLPGTAIPDTAMLAFIPLALVAPFFYGMEGNFVARWGTAGCGPFQTLFGASLIGVVLIGIIAKATGTFIVPKYPFSAPDYAIAGIGFVHALAYSGYVWLVGRAGSVFTSQVAYLVTGSGIVWAMIILGETYSFWVWLALATIFAGIFLVQPRNAEDSLEVGPRSDAH